MMQHELREAQRAVAQPASLDPNRAKWQEFGKTKWNFEVPPNLGFSLWGRYPTFPNFPRFQLFWGWKSWKTAQTQCLGNGHGVPVDVGKARS